MNPSPSAANHFLQIWIEPSMKGLQPRYSEDKVKSHEKLNQWKKIAGPAGSNASVTIHQDAVIYATRLQPGERLDYVAERGRYAWLQVAVGELAVNGTMLKSGDAVATTSSTAFDVQALSQVDALLFDLG